MPGPRKTLHAVRMLQTPDTLRRTHVILTLALLALLLGSSSAIAADGSCEAQAARNREAIPAEALANWEPVDDHTLLIWESTDRRAHLVQLDHPLPGLATADVIVLIAGDHDRTISACGHDGVMVQGADGGVARIVSMRYLSARRTAELDRGGATAVKARMTAV